MPRCIIIGGGLAGLSAGARLISSGYKVTLLEASPKLGGKATSFYDSVFDEQLDNGQHIIMGCYRETLDYMRLTGARDNLIYQPHLKIDYMMPGGKTARLDAGHSFYPVNLLSAVTGFSAIGTKEKLMVFKLMCRLPFLASHAVGETTVSEWLRSHGQNQRVSEAVWDFLSIGALNTSPGKASAGLFLRILKEIFLRGNFASTVILPKYDLITTFAEPARKYVEAFGGGIKTGERVTKIHNMRDGTFAVYTEKGDEYSANAIIAALPPYALEKVDGITGGGPEIRGYEYSSILTFHLLTEKPLLDKPFYGLIGSPLHWVFNHGKRLTTVISDADEFMDMNADSLFGLVLGELEKYFGIQRKSIQHYRMVKEKRATFVPSAAQLKKRPPAGTKAGNIFLAGDWTDTGLPATIESAILSGRLAAEAVRAAIK